MNTGNQAPRGTSAPWGLCHTIRARSLQEPAPRPTVRVAAGGRHLPSPYRSIPGAGDRGQGGGDRGAPLTLTPCLLAGRFAAKTVTSGSLVLVTLERREGAAAQLTVNSEKMVIGTMLVKDIVQALAQ